MMIPLMAALAIGTAQAQLPTLPTVNKPTVTTTAAGKIGKSSALTGGTVTVTSLTPVVTERGVVFGTKITDPLKATGKVTAGSGAGTFTLTLTSLAQGTDFNVWAYAKNSQGFTFGNMITFRTLDIPTVTTTAPTAITATRATSGGNVVSSTGSAVTARGVCWSTAHNPTPTLTTKTVDGTGTGPFTSSITGLQASQTFFVRAYATNSIGTGFGAEQTITTPAPAPRAIDLQARPTSASAENRKLFDGVPVQSYNGFAYLNIADAFCTGIPAGTLVDDFSCGNGGARCKIFEHTIVQLPPVIYKAINLGDSASGAFTVELYRSEKVNGTVGPLTQVHSSQVVGLAAGAQSGTFSFTPSFPQGLKVYTQDFAAGQCFVRRPSTSSSYPYLEESYVVKVDGGNASGGGAVKERTENNNEGNPMPAP